MLFLCHAFVHVSQFAYLRAQFLAMHHDFTRVPHGFPLPSGIQKVSGHAVAESLTAQYSTLQPLSIRRVQSHRSSPWSYWMQWMGKVERLLYSTTAGFKWLWWEEGRVSTKAERRKREKQPGLAKLSAAD